MLNLKIVNGTIIDGSGAARYRGDIGIKDGAIVALGDVEEAATQTIDAEGLAVSPGFIDIHTHYDAQALWDPTLGPSSYHGVTTIFGGFCGFSIAPLSPQSADYLMRMLARVEGMQLQTLAQGVPWDWTSFAQYLSKLEGRLAINAGFLAGHSAIRRLVMGPRAVGEAATADDIEKMKAVLRDCIRGGALGFSSSLSVGHNDGDGNPVPSRHASRRELLELYSVVSEFEGTIAEIAPPSLDFDGETCEILTAVSLAAKRPVNWNLLNIGALTPEEGARVARQLGASDHAHEHGGRVVALTLPQAARTRINLANGVIFDVIPGWAPLFRLPLDERMRVLRDPASRLKLKADAATVTGIMAGTANWPNLKILEVFSDANAPHRGRTVGEIAAEQGKDPFDAFVDIALADDLKTSFSSSYKEDGPEVFRERAKLWADPRTLIGGSDAGAHLDMIDTFAISTSLLALGVREHQVVSLEDAVRQLTSAPAGLMGLRDRGLLRQGWRADIVIFDPAEVGPSATYTRADMPGGGERLYADAKGIHHVIVNGRKVIRDNQYLGVPAGTVLRPGTDTFTVGIPSALAAE
jgi:N-acyl-D-aspartate/D-glutamate deacylase